MDSVCCPDPSPSICQRRAVESPELEGREREIQRQKEKSERERLHVVQVYAQVVTEGLIQQCNDQKLN